MLYLNQTIRVEPTRMKSYVEQFVGVLTPLMRRYGAELVGLWQALQANDFIDLWEVREWADLDRLSQAMKKDPAFVAYLEQAYASRSNWSVKILHPTPFCPRTWPASARADQGRSLHARNDPDRSGSAP